MSDESVRGEPQINAAELLAAGRRRVERSRTLIGLIDLLLGRKDESRPKKPPQH